jgi:putative transposase
VRFRFIEAEKAFYPIAVLCRNLQVQRSGFYAWRKRAPSRRAVSNGAALVHIRAIFRRHKQYYGSRRVKRALRDEGIRLGRHRVARIMRSDGLRARTRKRFRVATDSGHRLPVAENVLGRRFGWSRPNQAWLADMTYLWTDEGWAYLSCLLDLYSRRVIGWCVSEALEGRAARRLLEQAIAIRRPRAGLIHHSDRGRQYAGEDYQRVLRRHGITCSMSRKKNCWDNAPMESFFATLKLEIGDTRWPTRSAAAHAIAEYISYYNTERIHSTLDYLTPVQYEMKRAA